MTRLDLFLQLNAAFNDAKKDADNNSTFSIFHNTWWDKELGEEDMKNLLNNLDYILHRAQEEAENCIVIDH